MGDRNRVRYRLTFELHHIVTDDDAGTVVTVQRWDVTNSTVARTRYIVLENGAEAERTFITDPAELIRLSARLDNLTQRVTAISDEKARAEIKARTGIEHYPDCTRADCGERRPIGSDKCGDGHSTGQSGGASMGNLGRGRLGPIMLDLRTES